MTAYNRSPPPVLGRKLALIVTFHVTLLKKDKELTLLNGELARRRMEKT